MIGGHDRAPFGECLRDQQAVERIVVVQGEAFDGQDVVERDREDLQAFDVRLIGQYSVSPFSATIRNTWMNP